MPFQDHDHSRGIRESLAEVEEILEHLALGVAGLVQAAGNDVVPPDLINAIFRDAHSLKGVAGMLGYTSVSGLAHRVETLLDRLRLGKTPLDHQTVEVLEAALDQLSLLVRTSGSEEGLPSMTLILERINLCCARTVTPPSHPLPQPLLPERISATLNDLEKYRLAETVRGGGRLFLLHASFLLESFDREIESLIDLLKAQGEVISTIPAPGYDREDAIDFDILLGGDEPPKALPTCVTCEEIPFAERAVSAAQQPGRGDVPGTPSPDRRVSDRSVSGMVRVDIRALDELIALVGELVAAHSSLRDEVEQARRVNPTSAAALVKRAERVGKKVKELQQGIMEIRLVPVQTLYDKLARIVRRIAADEGRKLELELGGGETRLDKQIIEDISDPLMHLVRNAVDHGIEAPEERRSAGKGETGKITITAGQKGNLVVIQVADDGRGIDLAKVRRQAAVRGMVAGSRELTDREALELIFEPGFSTRDAVSELSGRGVGMEVVKSAITALSGSLALETEPGCGSRVSIALPITLAIIRTLIIEAGGESYGLPVSAIQETVAVTAEELFTREGSEFLTVREQSFPLVRLDRFFGLTPPLQGVTPGYVVVTGAASRRVGIMAEEIRGQHDLVLKPLGEPFHGVRGIAGAVELSDDRTILVLDPLAIIDEVCRGGGRGC